VKQTELYAKTHGYKRYDDIDIGCELEADVLACKIESLGAAPRDKKYIRNMEPEKPKRRSMDLE
jgi:hypothetical protein